MLRILLDNWEQQSRHSQRRDTNQAAKAAEGMFTAITEAKLINLLNGGKSGQFDPNQVIYIEPPPKEHSAVAALWCRWNFNSTTPECGFYFGLWSLFPSFPALENENRAKHIAFLGYRFETPEKSGDNHHFYHAQPCRSMGARDNPIRHAIPISHRFPTFPLAAESALELLLCLVTSLYGRKGLSKIHDEVTSKPTMRKNKFLVDTLSKALT